MLTDDGELADTTDALYLPVNVIGIPSLFIPSAIHLFSPSLVIFYDFEWFHYLCVYLFIYLLPILCIVFKPIAFHCFNFVINSGGFFFSYVLCVYLLTWVMSTIAVINKVVLK